MAYNHYILVCGGTACESNKSDNIYRNLLAEAEKQLRSAVSISSQPVQPLPLFYGQVG